jgi:anthranilate synthase/aminodeoxychorismate synthase-like glutamine amidotransferase
MILMIDNYDSFTYNLVQYVGEEGADIIVFRNDEITIEKIAELKPSKIIISPGPGCPSEAGISKAVIGKFGPRVPLLGVCLGHQSVGEVYGGKVVRAQRIMHGKVSSVYHNGKDIFKGVMSPFVATRYHSLLVEKSSVNPPLEITAWTDNDEVMGLKHKDHPIWGVQFHPESVLTAEGRKIIRNFLEL